MTAANDNGNARPVASAPAAKPCSICGKPAQAAYRPFCSRRCADVDLHRWLGGTYALPVTDEDPEPDEDPVT